MRTYRTETRKYAVGCGELRIRIAYKGDESFHFILTSLDNQDNQCGCCWLEAGANILTALFRRLKEDEIPAILKNLKNQRCKHGIKSCPNAIAKAVADAFAEETK
jgi:hypothetical protein